VDYYTKRDTPLAKLGLFALSNSLASLYYIPFQSGAGLGGRFDSLASNTDNLLSFAIILSGSLARQSLIDPK